MDNRGMKKSIKLLALILTCVMVMTSSPHYVFAENEEGIIDSNNSQQEEEIKDDILNDEEGDSDLIENEEDESVPENDEDIIENDNLDGLKNKSLKETKKIEGQAEGQADTSWYIGHESDDEFTLTDEEQLRGFSELVNGGKNFKDKTVKLDAELSSPIIKPIGTEENPFAGIFDGGGKEITDLQIETSSNQYIGLFGCATIDSKIRNTEIGAGTLKIVEDKKANGQQIRYVGSIVGYTKGLIENCDSSMKIDISSKMTMGQTKGIIRNVGGITGYTEGDIKDCTNTGRITITSSSDINSDVSFLVGEIGGIAGAQGDVEDPMKLPLTENCKNTGDFNFTITGKGGRDRFGETLYSISFAVGGIIGQTSGKVKDCINKGNLNTALGSNGETEAGRGADLAGGIVGSLRSESFEELCKSESRNTNFSREDAAYKYYKAHGGTTGGTAAYPKTAGIYDCSNAGEVIGLAAVGGIAGNGGSFTRIEGSSNTGDVTGCRWNKPFAAGIAGNIQGDIIYCYNRGSITSFTGAGYNCAGITGGLWVAHESNTEDKYRVPTSEMTGCYVTGTIYTSAAGYRTGILAAENEGFIHDNVYLKGITLDNKVVDSDSGTLANNEGLSNINDLKTSINIGHLNAYASGKGDWQNFYLPARENENDGFPVLAKRDRSLDNAVEIPSREEVTLEIKNASYNATKEAIPTMIVELKDGTELVQNADFYVVPESGAKKVTAKGETPYMATVVGMGKYKGTWSEKIPYGIDKADINACTIVAEATIFNWELQRPEPSDVKLIDTAGNEVPDKEYTVSDRYDESKGTKEYKEGTTYKHFDYTNCHGANYKYDVVVTANDGSSYEGKTTQQAYRIKWASMMAQRPEDDPKYKPEDPESVLYGDIVWKGKRLKPFLECLEESNTSGDLIPIPYTGSPITPTVKSVKYLGKEMRLSTDYDYQDNPLDYDYKYIYGNPNPETSQSSSIEPIDVTPADSPACMTVRFTNGGNFSGYVNVFYRIVAADIKPATYTISAKTYTGKALKPKPVVTWNKKKLKEGKDYTLSNVSYTSNKSIGKGKVTFTIKGKGNLKGIYKKTVNFKINPKTTKVSKINAGKKKMTVTYKKVSKAQKVTKYQVRYRVKGTSKWKIKTVKASAKNLTIKSLKKGKKYQVGVRAVKTIKSGSSKGTYYGKWSSTKTSGKIK